MTESGRSQQIDRAFRNPVQGLHEFANAVTLFRREPPTPSDPGPKPEDQPTEIAKPDETPVLRTVKLGETSRLTFVRSMEPTPEPNLLGKLRQATGQVGTLLLRH